MDKKKQEDQQVFFMINVMNYCVNNFGPGPKCIPFNVLINFQKCLMPVYIIWLMIKFNNFSDAMFYYLSLHGSYGKLYR